MTNFARLDHRLDVSALTCRAIIETPKGSRSKYTYEQEVEAFELTGLLPVGMSFPLDFGFIPSTLGQDGDPLDVLVLGDEPSVVGCLANVRLLGVIEAEQTERDGRVIRNDRLLARVDQSISYEGAAQLDDLGTLFIDHLGRFFTNYNALKGKGFKVITTAGPERAAALIRSASSHSPL
ncbi:inorganic diphosphatase [Novosphingobium terrae]|uniref:inorganic diphosphatase n=1 Tax=Novosphingobium terrae TaxID=2726189 RepID=UPI00197EBDFF|nr:inorganic diphosphatase [Novosphingobium terrae]